MMSAPRYGLQQLSSRFEVLSTLGEGGMGVVYEVLDHETGAVLAAKTLTTVSAERLYALKTEFRQLADVMHRNLIQLGELFCDEAQCFFTMELVRGHEIQEHVRRARGDRQGDHTETVAPSGLDSYALSGDAPAGDSATLCTTALAEREPRAFDEARLRDTFSQLAEAVHSLHGFGILHRDLKPSNVLVDDHGRVVVLDFGIAAKIQRSANDNDHSVTGTPAFMAPEQAQGQPLGPATDWYAFGVMLFFALTGRLPFSGTRAEQLLAKERLMAPLPSDLIESCPDDLNALCKALLARDPADRPSGGQIIEALGKKAPSRKRFDAGHGDDDAFVGRAPELMRLHDGLLAVAENAPVALLIEGPAGLGKTELVQRFLEQLTCAGHKVTVLQGRCYEQEFMAYKGLDTLVDALSRHLKSLDQDNLAALLPSRFNLVAALFPVLHRVPAVAKTIPSADVNETKPEQHEEAFAQLALLLQAIARDTRLVLFIDDLQWAGDDTLAALRYLTEGAVRPAMLVLATSREGARNEQGAGPTGATADAATTRPTACFQRILLRPLTLEESGELTRRIFSDPDALPMDGALRERLLHEAGGHPLFLRELSRYLQRGDALPSDLRLEDVLLERISGLPPKARGLLEVIAIAGVPLPTRVLARVAGIHRSESADMVRLLRAAQLVRVSRRSERSQQILEPYHDRVREAVGHGVVRGGYTLTVASDTASVHLALARELLQMRNGTAHSVSSALLANQYNLGVAASRNADDACEAVAANLEAARAAKLAASYKNSLHHLDAARSHAASLAEGAAKASALRAIDLRDLELALLMDARSRADEVFARLLRGAPADGPLAEAYQVKIIGETAMNRHADALASAREGLGRLNFAFPRKGSPWRVLLDVLKLELAIRGHTSDSIVELPLSTNERTRAQSALLMAAGPAAFFTDTALMSLLALRVTLLTLQRGVSEFSAYGFASYALVLAGAFKNYARANELGLLAKRLNQRLRNRALDCKLETLHMLFCLPYVAPIEEVWPSIQRAQELGLANGDLTFRTYAGGNLSAFKMLAGSSLSEQKAACEVGLRVAEQEGAIDIMLVGQLRLRAIRCLDGANSNPLQMDGTDSSEQQLLSTFGDKPLQAARFWYYFQQAILGVHFDDAAFALRAAQQTEAYIAGQFNMPTLIELSFYVALAATRRFGDAGTLERVKLLALAWSRVDHLKGFAKANERNFASRYLLARAELRRVLGRRRAARSDLDAAISLAQRHGTHNVLALAFERLATWHGQFGAEEDRREALANAVAAYRRWEAPACAEMVERRLAGPA